MTLKQMPYDELDRHHQQAKIALEAALTHQDKSVYRNAEEAEERYRKEKIRRQRERDGPPPDPIINL